MDIESIARVCHAANRAYCLALGDPSQVAWDDAPSWLRESVVAGVRWRLANPFGTPAGSHEAWVAAKEAKGWRYGPTKDFSAKEHPCLLPYDELAPEQRVKDALFIAIVDALCVALPPLLSL